jgi:HEAT repeat protein
MESKESKPFSLPDLIEQLPLTDREVEILEAAQPAPSTEPPPEESKKKKEPRPIVPGEGSKFTGPAPSLADDLCEQVLAGGNERIVALIQLIRDPGSPEFKNYKAEYLLHCLVIYAGRPDKAPHRERLLNALTSQLSNPDLSVGVRALLLRELQWIGTPRVVAALGDLLNNEELCQQAVMALVAIGTGADRILRAAVAKTNGRNRLAVIQCLAIRADERSQDILRPLLADPDADVRLAAAWGLAKLADAGSAQALLKLADADANYERMKATHACLMLAEKLAAAGNPREAARIYTHLRDTRQEKAERYIREVAETALRALVV